MLLAVLPSLPPLLWTWKALKLLLQGAEKLIISKMLVENSNRRTFPVDRHAGVVSHYRAGSRQPAGGWLVRGRVSMQLGSAVR